MEKTRSPSRPGHDVFLLQLNIIDLWALYTAVMLRLTPLVDMPAVHAPLLALRVGLTSVGIEAYN